MLYNARFVQKNLFNNFASFSEQTPIYMKQHPTNPNLLIMISHSSETPSLDSKIKNTVDHASYVYWISALDDSNVQMITQLLNVPFIGAYQVDGSYISGCGYDFDSVYPIWFKIDSSNG